MTGFDFGGSDAQPMRFKIPSVPRNAPRSAAAGAAAVLVAVAAGNASAAPDADALIARLARAPLASIAFAEVRFSSLLVEPLVIKGTLEYAGAEALRRRVEEPYRESTLIDGEAVRVEREGEAPRTFALRRAPELRGLLTGMIGLLTGDASFIAERFEVTAAGDDDRWRLDLVPLDRRLEQHLSRIVVAGGGAEPHCYVIRDDKGGASVMLLDALATEPLRQPLTLADLLSRCGAE
jgi:hypothetical protein